MGFDPSTVRQSLHVLTSGLEVAMDDDVVRRMREGQHMVLEIERLFAATTTKGEWGMTLDGERAEGNAESELCEIRLLFQGRYAVGDASSERFFS